MTMRLRQWTERFGAVALLVLPLAVSRPAAAQADVSALVSRHGLRAVSPPAPATDFTLPDVAGGTRSLSDLHGRWVMLTFFATWCGPCRSEMPSLEQLFRSRGGSGLTVLGVSVDNGVEPVRPFVDKLGITFPVLWDKDGKAASAYAASSIPLSYLVDPQGRIVGVAQGARDWSDAGDLFEQLLAAMPPDQNAPRDYAAADAPVALPPGVEPPTAEVALATAEPVAGRSFVVEVRLRWTGRLEDYLPLPPQVHLPEGVTREGVSASSSSRDGSNLVTYQVALRADKAGSYALDPVELRYSPRLESAPLTTRLVGPTIMVRPVTMLGLRPLTLAATVGGAVVVLGAATVLVRRRRRPRPELDEDSGRYAGLRSRFDAARADRLRGDASAFVLALVALERELADGTTEPAVGLEELADKARYGGEAPPAEELNRLERRVERRLEALRPDPERQERAGVQLATRDMEG